MMLSLLDVNTDDEIPILTAMLCAVNMPVAYL